MQVPQVVEEKFKLEFKYIVVALALILVGVVSLGISFTGDDLMRKQAWANFLQNNYYFLCLSLSGLFFVAVNYAVKSGWVIAIRQIPFSMTSFLPIAGLLMFLVYFGMHDLYHWTHAELYDPQGPHFDPILNAKRPYLVEGFFMIRLGIAIGLWILFMFFMRQTASKEIATGELKFFKRNFKTSCFFLVVFGVSFSMVSFDLIMSLEPHWFSTIFAVYNFAGLFVNGLVVILLLILFLKGKGYMSVVNDNHIHDITKLIFGFSVFWAYIWLSQLLLIWYANIPEEVTYYQLRFASPYGGLFWINFLINFVVPFLALIKRNNKKRVKLLNYVCVALLIGHWLDIYLMVMPGVFHGAGHHGPSFLGSLLSFGTFLGYAGFFALVVLVSLSRKQLVPSKAPYLEESLTYHQSP